MKKLLSRLKDQHNLRLVILGVLAAIHLFILKALLSADLFSPTAATILVLVLYVALAFLAMMILRMIYFKHYEMDLEKNYSTDVSSGLYNNIVAPIIACDEAGNIQWGNKAFRAMLREVELTTKRLPALTGVNMETLLSTLESGEEFKCSVGKRIYQVKGHISSPSAANLFVTVWYDITELEETRAAQLENETLVAYIVIDNLEELIQIEQENVSSAAAQVELVLRDFADSYNGILKSYERDKYVFLYKAHHLQSLIEDKFEILEKVRSVRVGANYFPVTVSIGTSTIGDTLSEKEKSAQSALEMALARGGDQAVVKTDKGVNIFGGITKTVQKRTTIKSRTVAQALASLVTGSRNVLIMGHRNPDYDSIGSCVGAAKFCMLCGVKCNIIIDRKDPNLAKCFDLLSDIPAYDDIFVDAESGQNLINSKTLLIITDVNNPKQFEAPRIAENVHRIVYIDHHRMTGEFEIPPALYYIEPSASSASELMSEILEQSALGSLKKEEAELLYAGIILDTKRFSINTGVRTFTAALYLRGEGADPIEVQELFRTELTDMEREARFQINIARYRKYIAIAVNPYQDNIAADRIIAAKVADKLLTAENVLASFALCEIDGAIRISARSTGTINVQIILERLNGGGHYDAAATQMSGTSMETALLQLKESIDQFLDVDSKSTERN
ncbi:MAG: DHH family phosphoesterase [Clostridia bacterium]|nr:DHH family phosphoesterase [Clostridia bacterium]